MFTEENTSSYKGNKNLRPRDYAISYTADQLNEIDKCLDDPIYFMKNYIKIVMLGKGLQPFNMYPFQEKMVHSILDHRNSVFKLPRQSGKTTTVAAFAIHQTLFKDSYSILIAANKARTAIEIMKRIRDAYQSLPKWLQQGVTKWNEGSVEFENGSRIVAVPTTGDAARGFSYDMIILDEFAFLPKNIANDFFTSVIPTISASDTTKIAILSTPKGMNHFFDIWDKAIKGEADETGGRFYPIEIKWNEVPGRDENFKKRMIETYSGDINRWLQEFEADFIGSSNTLVNPKILQNLRSARKNPTGSTDQGLKFYEEAKPDHSYFICVDTSEGKGQDYHAATVIDITEKPFKVVALFKNNTMPIEMVPNVICNLAKIYNQAFVLIETRSLGASVAYSLFYELEYPNMLGAQPRGRNGLVLAGFDDQYRGLSTSNQSRVLGCDRLKVLMETDQLIFWDIDMIDEISNFILSKNKYQADEGWNDDLVMTLVMFSWATTTLFFKELTKVNIKDVFQDNIKKLQEDVVPFGYVLDSYENNDAYDEGPLFDF